MRSGRLRALVDIRDLQQAFRNSPRGGLGGVGRYSRTVIEALGRAGGEVDLHVLLDRGQVAPELGNLLVSSAATVHRDPFPSGIARRRYGRAAPLIQIATKPLDQTWARLDDFDIIHCLGQPPRFTGKRVVATLHDLFPIRAAGQFSGVIARGLRRSYGRYSHVGLVLCNSVDTARRAESTLGLHEHNQSVVYPGIDTGQFSKGSISKPPKEYVRRRRFLLHVGMLRDRKNPLGLLTGFSAFAKAFDFDLVCVGPYQVEPRLSSELFKLAATLQVEDRLVILGDCSDSELAWLYSAAAATVFPSFEEGFGYPVAESLACGTPCVTSQTSSLSEAGGNLATYVDPSDPDSIARGIAYAVADPIRDRVSHEGPLWAARFSLDRFARELILAYKAVI
jgi:glycosyltransferase involved in cell wall biosynthesis